jgi:hypothetical protein
MPALTSTARAATHAFTARRGAVSRRNPRSMQAVRAFFGGGAKTAASSKSAHEFTVKDIDGKDVKLSKYAGKVCLVVNVASE